MRNKEENDISPLAGRPSESLPPVYEPERALWDSAYLQISVLSVNHRSIKTMFKYMKFSQNRISEGLIQCELYHRLKMEGIESYPEYTAWVDGRKCRFDLVIIQGDDIVMIIECKVWAHRNTHKTRGGFTEQYKKYKKTGLPILYCVNIEGINRTVRKIKQFLKL